MSALRIVSNDLFPIGERQENYEWLVNGKIWRLEFRYNLDYIKHSNYTLEELRKQHFENNYAPKDPHLASIMVSEQEYKTLKNFLQI